MAEAVEELALAYPGRALKHARVGEGVCAADADRLAQLVGNLVSNAMTYGTPECPVTVTSSPIDAELVTIAVHNHGRADPPEVQTRIFQPMTRGTEAGSASRSVGLGLFIVSEIAQAHGGRTSVTSQPGEGTTSRRHPAGASAG